MFTKAFGMDLLERAVKTFAQALAAVLVVGVPIYETDWKEAVGLALTAALLSVLTSVASVNVGEKGTAGTVPLPEVGKSAAAEYDDASMG